MSAQRKRKTPEPSVSHERFGNSLDQLAPWFQSLSMSRRLEILDELVAFAIEMNDGLPEKPDVEPVPGRIQVVSLPKSEIRRYWRSRRLARNARKRK